MKRFLVLFVSLFLMIGATPANAAVSDFEGLYLDLESYWNGSDESGGFSSGDASFNNNYDSTWGSWDGFSYSNITDTTTDGMGGQYNAITGGGLNSSSKYAVSYYSAWAANPPTATRPSEQVVTGAYFTNNNYAYYSMLNGDAYAKKFEEGDWFKLTITGKDATGTETGIVDAYLANGTNIVRVWTWVDLSSLGKVKSLEFTLSSSDTGDWGMNTPAYFCMDSLNGTPPLTGSISGVVTTDIVGHVTPVEGGIINLAGTGLVTTTNASGEYSFNNVPEGTYELQIEATYFEPMIVSNVNVTSGVPTSVSEIQLSLPTPPQILPGDATGDGKLGLDDVIYILQVLSGVRTQIAP
ncbi:MAG: DUF4465 domain-containing protein [Desulfobacterales bacterium]|nr:DUF4465 domain-containing protein [Desulfobacterales bacterium]